MLGTYRHFKGEEYELICIAKDATTLVEQAIYQSVKTKEYWSRPLREFFSEVTKPDYVGPRFIQIGEKTNG